MTAKGRPPLDTAADVRACQAQGMTQQQTAERLGVSLSNVQKHWQRAEQRGRPSNTAERVAQLAAEGMTTAQIAERLGVARSTVTRSARKIRQA